MRGCPRIEVCRLSSRVGKSECIMQKVPASLVMGYLKVKHVTRSVAVSKKRSSEDHVAVTLS